MCAPTTHMLFPAFCQAHAHSWMEHPSLCMHREVACHHMNGVTTQCKHIHCCMLFNMEQVQCQPCASFGVGLKPFHFLQKVAPWSWLPGPPASLWDVTWSRSHDLDHISVSTETTGPWRCEINRAGSCHQEFHQQSGLQLLVC